MCAILHRKRIIPMKWPFINRPNGKQIESNRQSAEAVELSMCASQMPWNVKLWNIREFCLCAGVCCVVVLPYADAKEVACLTRGSVTVIW